MSFSPEHTIALVRHGETDWNLDRRIQGRTEVPLNATGRAQAAATARLLAEAGPWNRAIASPLGRAIQTAEIIADALDLLPPRIDADLIERDFGLAEGQLVADIEMRWPGFHIPGAEPLDDMAARAAGAMERILAAAPGSVVVAHGAMLRFGLARLIGEEMPRVHNGEVWLLRPAGGSTPRLTRLAAR